MNIKEKLKGTIDQEVTVTVQGNIVCSLTAKEWDLYDIEGSDQVAEKLNMKLESLIKKGCDEAALESEMHDFMSHYSGFGAFDTEPRSVLAQLIMHLFDTDKWEL